MSHENKDTVDKYFIIQDIQFSDFMKDYRNNIILYDTIEEARKMCWLYEFPNALICKVEQNYIES